MEKYRCSGNPIDLSTAGAFPLTTLIAAFTNLFGTPFVMLSTGLNGFINAQGFLRVGIFFPFSFRWYNPGTKNSGLHLVGAQ